MFTHGTHIALVFKSLNEYNCQTGAANNGAAGDTLK